MRFGSVCSGIEAASVAWGPLGWSAAWLAEIEAFPSAVLAHHYPQVPNLGDMTTIARRVVTGEVEAPDVLAGGTPCQAFSVAGLRESLADARGNLTLKYVELLDAIDHVRVRAGKPAAIAVWENVPGVLSTKDNAFGCFLAGLAGEDDALEPPGGRWADSGCVYGPSRAIAWRTLDAQYFGLAQRRRRVFVVASARNGFDPATVLFEWQGVRRDSAPSREAGKAAPTIPARSTGGGGLGTDFDCDGGLIHCHDVAPTLNASFGSKQGLEDQHIRGGVDCSLPDTSQCLTTGTGMRYDPETETLIPTTGGGFDVAHSLRAEGFDASEDGTGRGTPLWPVHAFDARQSDVLQYGDISGPMDTGFPGPTIAFSAKDHGGDAQEDLAPTLRAGGHSGSHANAGVMPAVALALRGREGGGTAELGDEVGNALRASGGGGDKAHVFAAMAVRRLTPEECESLMGMPRGYTAIPYRGKPAADGPRYKSLGNSWAVPVARWVGMRVMEALPCTP